MATNGIISEVDHLIVGAGFGGLAAAIKLDRNQRGSFVVIEKGADVGGTWRDNTYPGAACDVPSQLYSYSFALNPNWSMSFSPQPEIQAYIRDVAERSGTLDKFCFHTELVDARWDEDAQHWLATTRGKDGEHTYAARNLITASGGLSEPRLPDIDGIDSFQGEIFHSARWNHDTDLTGKRVAVIGTGASAIQIVPQVQQLASRLDVYQRTAPYVVPRNDRTYTGIEKFGFKHIPGLQRLYRTAIYWGREMYVPAFTRNPKLAWPAKKLALANIGKAISDPALREKVTPDYEIGCKRILISNTYYPALGSDNVDVVTDPISKVTGSSIVTADGQEREIDVLIVATGFYTTEQPIAERVTGRDGQSLATVWQDSGQLAYKGTTVSGFPNLFQIVGPNTGLGHSSMVFMIESQVDYIDSALATMEHRGWRSVEPTVAAQRDWNADMQQRMQRTVWHVGGCASWYLDDHGRNTTLWPRATFTFRRLLNVFDSSAYVTTTTKKKVIA